MFRKLLKEYMLKNDINQAELSKLLGDSRQAVSDFITNKGNPQSKTKEKYFNSIKGFKEFYDEARKKQDFNIDKSDLEKIAEIVMNNHNEFMTIKKYKLWFEVQAQRRAIEILKQD